MPAGDYTTTAFEPTLHFRLRDGWQAFFIDDSDEIAMDSTDGTGFMAITRVTKVVERTGIKPVPDDLIDWLAKNPAFDWSGEPVPVTVDGISGSMLEGTVRPEKASTDVFGYTTGNMRVAGGDHMRYYVLPLDGPDLTIVLTGIGGDQAFDTTLDRAQATLDSLEIVPS